MRIVMILVAPLALAPIFALGCNAVVRADEAPLDGGPSTASLTDLNGGLALPGVPVTVSPNIVATSSKVYLRKDKSTPPNCYYGVFASDPAFLPGGDGGVQPNNGLLLVALADNNALATDPAYANGPRTGCPEPNVYSSGGGIPDLVKPGDVLQDSGELTPYCDSFDTRAEECAVPIFPEFTVSQLGDMNQPDGGQSQSAQNIEPVVVAPALIADGSSEALGYAGMLLEVDDVTISNAHPDAYSAVTVTPGNLWLDTFDSRANIPQVAGQHFSKVVGNLDFSYGHWRLEPRTQADIQD